MVPVHLLVWAVVTFITTFTCLLAVWEWDDRTEEQKWTLSMMYGPYAAFGTFPSESSTRVPVPTVQLRTMCVYQQLTSHI
jgi:hypothetical protein